MNKRLTGEDGNEITVTFMLVVSRTYPQGTIMTANQYGALYDQMSTHDRISHRIEIIDGETAYRMACLLDKRHEKAAQKEKIQNKSIAA